MTCSPRSFRRLTAMTLTLLGSSSLIAADEPGVTNRDSRAVQPKPADGDAPLPVGFPDATPPGEILVKDYPGYRSAVARGKALSLQAGDTLFFSLFNHISRKGVAMTAPVINTYESSEMIENPRERGDVAMEFLYERPDQGEAGPGVGIVQVEDHPAITVVSLGLQGEMTKERMRDGLARLRSWLEDHAGEWTASGQPRRLGYHGPMTPEDQRLWEVQIPIQAVRETANQRDATSPEAPDQP